MTARPGSGGVRIDLSGRVALVTGGSRGIGRACVEALARAGAVVAFSYHRRPAAARAVTRAVAAGGGTAIALRADVGSAPQAAALVKATLRRFGHIDILVNNAGIWEPPGGRRLERMSAAQWRRTLRVNLDGAFHCTRAVIPAMKRRRRGRIVFVSSTAGQRGEDLHADYAASKGALISLTKSLAVEWAAQGIRVNALCPGWTATELNRNLWEDETAGPATVATVPMRRWARPDEMTGAAVFLASEASSYMTGQVLVIDGGQTAMS
jgi:NAD(P)-dependent dehydrogenase (short-subunit alcohol dehydrogenase family)